MKFRKNIVIIVFGVLLTSLVFISLKNRIVDQNLPKANHVENKNEKMTERSITKSNDAAGGGIIKDKDLLPGEVRLRFDPLKHPFASTESADFYYSKYRQLLFPDASNPRLIDEKVLADLKDNRNLHLALGQVGELEIIGAIPYLLEFLKRSEDPSLQRKSAKLLAQFGKAEGFEFLLDNYNSETLLVDQLLFDVLTFYKKVEYLPRVREMLAQEMPQGEWRGRSLARILAYFGDETALEFYLPKLKEKRNFDDVDMALIANIQSKELIQPLRMQYEESDKSWAKLAAAYALTRQGEMVYQDGIIKTALLALSMPEAKKNPEEFRIWSSRNGGENGSGISAAVGYLSQIITTQSVAALETIASAKTVYSQSAIVGLAKMGTRESRDALLRIVEDVKGSSMQNYLAKALTLYQDEEATTAASNLFDWEKGKNLSFFLAETKGSDGLFEERIKRW